MLRLRMLKMRSPRKLLLGLFPIFEWSKTYDGKAAIGDLIAGITIALTLIPQSIAYASLAGFEPQYGLYASFMGPFIYAIMGTCPQVNLGPTALLSLLTFTYTNGTNAHFGILLCFTSSIVQLIAGFAQLGFLVEFISLPVVSGFTSAAALTVASSQVKGLLGLKFSADTFVSTWQNLFIHVKNTRLNDSLLSLGCCGILQGMKLLKDVKIKMKAHDDASRRKALILKRSLWFIGVARNATVVALATTTAYLVYEDLTTPFLLTGEVTPGLPAVRPPPFETTVGNTTYTTGEMLSHIGSGLFVVPVVGILSNVAIAKAFAKGKSVNATQEIIALGVCNLVSSFFQSMVVNGSFSRSAVSNASGVRTPGSGIYTGILVILTLVLLTPFFYFIPRAALSSVIVCAVLQMVDIAVVKKLWKISIKRDVWRTVQKQVKLWKLFFTRLDIIPLMGTFLCCLFLGIEIGLLCGVGIDALLLLYYHSRPPLDVKYVDNGTLPAHFAIRPVGGLHFAGAERVRSQLFALEQPKVILSPLVPDGGTVSTPTATQAATVARPSRMLVIYCESLYRMDYTFLESIKMLVLDWSEAGTVIWCDAKDNIKKQLKGVLPDPIFCEKSHLRTFMSTVIEPQSTA